jgi:hypothetical protein
MVHPWVLFATCGLDSTESLILAAAGSAANSTQSAPTAGRSTTG